MVYLMVLATIMAIFGVIGYLAGTRAAAFTTAVLTLGLVLLARAGGSVARLANGLYFGVHFVLAGGVQAMSGSGDRTAAVDRVVRSMGPVQPLLPQDAPGVELFILLVLLVALSLWLARRPRFHLTGSASGWGLVWGLISGYLIGAVLVTSLWPAQTGALALPFALSGSKTTAAVAQPDTWNQLWRGIQTTSESTLGLVVMLMIAVFLIVAALAGTRGTTGRTK